MRPRVSSSLGAGLAVGLRFGLAPSRLLAHCRFFVAAASAVCYVVLAAWLYVLLDLSAAWICPLLQPLHLSASSALGALSLGSLRLHAALGSLSSFRPLDLLAPSALRRLGSVGSLALYIGFCLSFWLAFLARRRVGSVGSLALRRLGSFGSARGVRALVSFDSFVLNNNLSNFGLLAC